MADNVAITAGTGTTIAADDIGGVLHQRVKISQGADGSGTDVSSAAPLQVTLANTGSNATSVNVAVASAIPAGTNAIGKLAANAGVNIGTVTVDATQLSTLGQTTMSASQPVTLASDQTWPVSTV